jgi:hypothetical protein
VHELVVDCYTARIGVVENCMVLVLCSRGELLCRGSQTFVSDGLLGTEDVDCERVMH